MKALSILVPGLLLSVTSAQANTVRWFSCMPPGPDGAAIRGRVTFLNENSARFKIDEFLVFKNGVRTARLKGFTAETQKFNYSDKSGDGFGRWSFVLNAPKASLASELYLVLTLEGEEQADSEISFKKGQKLQTMCTFSGASG